jgi:hypothetical protein
MKYVKSQDTVVQNLQMLTVRSNDTPVGWSAHGGLTLSAYRREDLDDKDQPVRT